jgi:Predicted carbamoyl transferase, NodU family
LGIAEEMGKRTGVPGVLNTSFNRRGPIVETPEDALNTYYYGEGLDFLVIGHFLLKRKDNIIPSVLNGRDENKLKNLFDAGMASDKALTGPWDAFWTEANRLAASKAATHQHYLIVNVDDGGNSREVLRVPLVKEMFQEGPREVMIANLSEKIQKEIGRNGPVTISIETTAPQFRDIVVDFFQRFAPEDIKKNWNIVTFGFGERSPPKDSPQQKRVRFVEASEALNKNIQKWQEEKRATPILVAVTGPDEKGRDSLLDRLQGKHFVIDAGAWNLDASQVNTSLYYPFSNVRFNDYVNALKRLKSGQTAMIPLPQVLSEGLPQRGFVLLNAEIKEKYRSFLVKEGSSVWVRHDGQLFEEIKPEAGDVFVVNTPVALNYPVLRGLFEESYFVAIDKELETPLRTGNDAAILNSTREVKFASTIIEPEKDNRGDNPQTSWVPLNTPLPIKQFDSMCIALTNYCPVGCAFCFMRSVQNKRNKISLDSKAIERILYYAKKNQVYRLMLSGGEPLSEMETVLRIIREAEVPNITIFTSAFFASDASHAQEVLGQLAAAVEERKQSGKKPIHILLDVSVDEFHARRVPQRNIINIIKEFDGNWNSKFADFTLQVKGILSEKDPIPGLIKTLGGKIQGDAQSGPFPIKPVILPSGYAFTVRYSEIKLLKDMLGTELARKQFDKVYQKRLEEDAIYVGRGERDGANFSINYDGVVSVNDYLAKNFVLGNANNDNFANDIDRRLRFDPLVVALREIGLNTVLDIASRLRPNIRGRSIETNNQFIAVSDILEDEELREYVYKELIQLIEKRENPAEKYPLVIVRS